MAIAQQHESLEFAERENALQQALHAGTGVARVRSEIMALTDEFEAKKWFTQKNIQANRQYLSEDNEYNTEENLQAFYQWMREQGGEAENWMRDFEGRVAQGERKGYVSKSDKEHFYALLMDYSEKNDFVYNLDFLKEESDKKLEHLQKARKRYDVLRNHKLIRNTDFLKTDENTKINFPDEKTFMAMTVKERDELLDKVEEALPKAEEYAEKSGEVESLKQYQEYKKLLDTAKDKKKIIGKKVHRKFLEGFKVCDSKEKGRWIKEFDSQMERYDKLWKDIRSQTKGNELKYLESLRDHNGYSEMLHEFKETEGKLDKKYEKDLLRYYQEGVIGMKTFDTYVSWIKKQPIPKKYEALEKLDSQEMKPRRELWNKIDNDKALNKEARQYLHDMKDEWGLTKTTEEYNRLRNGGKVPQGYKFQINGKDPLASITNSGVRQAIIETNELLEQQGGGRRKRFIMRLKKMFSGLSRDRFDAGGYQTDLLKEKKKLKREKVKEKIETSDPDHKKELISDFQSEWTQERSKHRKNRKSSSLDEEKIQEEMGTLDRSEKVQISTDRGFREVKTGEGYNVQAYVNSTKGLKEYMRADEEHNYRTEAEGGKDNISFVVWQKDGKDSEMDSRELRALKEHLEKEENEGRHAA